MATVVELDPVFRQALKFLHSPNSDAAENIRKALDDVIKQKHGSHKMLINTLSKKYIAEESKATGSGVIKSQAAGRRSSNKSSNSSSSSPVQIIATTSSTSATTTVITTDLSGQTQEIPVIISMPDASSASIGAIDDNAMDTNIHNSLFDELSCLICRRIDLSAKNRLIECTKCTSLYHQDCHNPQISDSDLVNGQESTWCCSNCRVKKFKSSSSMTGSPSKSNISSSSPTSSSSSNSDVIITGTSTAPISGNHSSSSSSKKDKEHSSSSSKSKSSSSSRHHSSHHHSSSSSSHHSSKHERSSERSSEKSGGSGSSSSSSSKSSVTPNIHIISADKRLQNMKKKAAKSQESKRKK